ncbi:MAG: hypothetical protein ACLFTK_11735 [Anaerolineales bacterium]
MIELTAPGKQSIVVETPVLFAAGAAGYDGAPYRKLLSLDKFGALVTPPLTPQARNPARGPRVVPLPSGFLLHTGLPNPGLSRAIKTYTESWRRSVLPIIVHFLADDYAAVEQMARLAERTPEIAGVELGLHDQASIHETRDMIDAVKQHTQLPLLVKLPLYGAVELTEVAQRNGADALVVAAPPRGTARDPMLGRLIGGRVYGPWLKAQSLRAVGQIVDYADVPVIGCGGIHTPDDARDFITAGARAVMLDSVVWVNPRQAEVIARNLGGAEITRTSGALADEWHPGMGDTIANMPPDPPELPPSEEDATQDGGVNPFR